MQGAVLMISHFVLMALLHVTDVTAPTLGSMFGEKTVFEERLRKNPYDEEAIQGAIFHYMANPFENSKAVPLAERLTIISDGGLGPYLLGLREFHKAKCWYCVGGRYENALAYFLLARKREPEKYPSTGNIVACLIGAGRFDDALYFASGLSGSDSFWKVYVLLKHGQTSKAKKLASELVEKGIDLPEELEEPLRTVMPAGAEKETHE